MHSLRTLLSVVAVSSVAVGGTLLAATPASATTPPTTYYVNCAAKSAGPGTAKQPIRTLAAVNAHAAFLPGDRILLKRGTTCKGRLAPRGSGAPGAPISIGAYGSGAKPTVAGGGTGQYTGAVQLKNQHDWLIENLHVTNRTGKARFTTVYRSGILISNTGVGRLANFIIRNNVLDNVTSNLADSKKGNSREYGGISVLTTGSIGSGFDKVRISSNKLNGVGRTGITTWNAVYNGTHDTNVRIDRNSVRWARGDSIVTVGLDTGLIDRNVSAYGSNMSDCPNCGGISPKVANAGIWPGGSRNVTIEYNEVYGEHMWGGDGEGFDIDSSTQNIVLQYNYSHDNEGGGALLCGSDSAIVRFNIFENNKKSAIAFIGTYPAKNTKIYNNTIYNSKASKARVVRYFNGAKGKGISFSNNLVYNYGTADYLWPAKVTTAANTLVGLHGKGAPHDAKTSKADPGLKAPGTGKVGRGSLAGYKPKHPSTFKKGVAIPSTVTRDFFGKKIDPKHPPRGAAG